MIHINPSSGELSRCRAKSPESCPFGTNFHFNTVEQAIDFNDIVNELTTILIKKAKSGLGR